LWQRYGEQALARQISEICIKSIIKSARMAASQSGEIIEEKLCYKINNKITCGSNGEINEALMREASIERNREIAKLVNGEMLNAA
jgi:hypothetical protein